MMLRIERIGREVDAYASVKLERRGLRSEEIHLRLVKVIEHQELSVLACCEYINLGKLRSQTLSRRSRPLIPTTAHRLVGPEQLATGCGSLTSLRMLDVYLDAPWECQMIARMRLSPYGLHQATPRLPSKQIRGSVGIKRY